MCDINSTEVHSRTLTAFFDTRAAADQAIRDLEAAGIPRQQIRRVDGNSSATTAATGSETGFWASLKDMFMPDEDRYGYAEGLRRGGYIVSVTADEANYTRVMGILDRDGSVDMDEREASWRKEGWTGYQTGSAVTSGAVVTPTVAAAITKRSLAEDRAGYSAPIQSTAAAATATVGRDAARLVENGNEEVVPLYEEQLRVGKRDVSHGRVRLRSYVVETPVSEQIGLREERVSVERRPVDRAVTGLSADVFKERVIEVEERAEEAVISKDVRLKEEITLRKESDERTETVSDTVRRTEVDVQDDRGTKAVGTAAPVMSTSFAGLIAEHMDVIASDGSKVGTVDHMDDADRIKLTKTASPDGQHHFVPLSWVDHVDQHVHLNKDANAVRTGW